MESEVNIVPIRRPETTMFLTMSVDGRITSHDSDELDSDKTWKQDPKIQARMQQFFEFAEGGIHTVTYGEAMAKVGVNTREGAPQELDINMILIDDLGLITNKGIRYLARSVDQLYVLCMTDNPILHDQSLPKDVHLITQEKLNLKQLLITLTDTYQIQELSIQSNARLNARWISLGLIDMLSIVISPLLVGRHGTPNLIDQELLSVAPLELIEFQRFGIGFVNLQYRVLNAL